MASNESRRDRCLHPYLDCDDCFGLSDAVFTAAKRYQYPDQPEQSVCYTIGDCYTNERCGLHGNRHSTCCGNGHTDGGRRNTTRSNRNTNPIDLFQPDSYRTLAVSGTLPTSAPVGSRPATYVLHKGAVPYCIARRFDVESGSIAGGE